MMKYLMKKNNFNFLKEFSYNFFRGFMPNNSHCYCLLVGYLNNVLLKNYFYTFRIENDHL